MAIGSVFENNRTQAVRLPAETRFSSKVKKVMVRVIGHERILSPVDKTWDSFFLAEDSVSDDLMKTRASQEQSEREALLMLKYMLDTNIVITNLLRVRITKERFNKRSLE